MTEENPQFQDIKICPVNRYDCTGCKQSNPENQKSKSRLAHLLVKKHNTLDAQVYKDDTHAVRQL